MRLAVSILVALIVLTVDASADEVKPRTYVQTLAPRELCKDAPDATPTPAGMLDGAITKDAGVVDVWCRTVPAGRFLDETSWLEMDAKLRELENTRTNLTAQNNRLRSEMQGWQPGIVTLAVTLVAGFAGGVYAYHKLGGD